MSCDARTRMLRRSMMPRLVAKDKDIDEQDALATMHWNLACCDYPERWPTAFTDFIGCRDVALRVLEPFGVSCNEDTSQREFVEAFVAHDFQNILSWARACPEDVKTRALVSMAAVLPQSILAKQCPIWQDASHGFWLFNESRRTRGRMSRCT